MRHNPAYASDDPAVVRELVRRHPWATIVSHAASGPVASHYPVLLAPGEPLVLQTHLGRPDERLHDFGAGEVLVIIQGEHGYVSPSWYTPGSSRIPTWNFTAAHLWGTPRLLPPEENLDVLTRLVAHFEQQVEDPFWLDRGLADPVARGTVGLEIPVSRFTLKIKLSQDKDPESVDRVITALRRPGPYQQPGLADDMERERSRPSPG